ncbi:GspH/FimT family pseudopilin [Dasania marina]|uniref:GspH/FimT family pseudopilin n=1 Tax=Dasania marina TaxID=471499 RepID=UPI0030D82918|tara:strand:+ start:127802 stop:128380 length:579 start_codon:yes stop_codon:yes gene_type:complete
MKKFNRGFTMIELMITLLIAAVLVVAAMPDMSATIERNRIDGYRADLIRDISFARQEAITRNIPITICNSADGASCTATTDWKLGWIVFIDKLSGTSGIVDGTDQVLKIHSAINSQDKLQATENYFQFNSRGWLALPLPSGSANTDIILTTCSKDDNFIKGVLVLASGRPVASRVDGSGDDYVKTGVALSCP